MIHYSPSIDTSSIDIFSHRFNSIDKVVLNKTFYFAEDPWRLIRNNDFSIPPRDLRLIIHGSKGGIVHPILNYVIERVKYLRGSSVELEVLTEKEPRNSNSSSIWLVPLFLLPGEHVRNDVPRIFQRLKNEGIKATRLPFLGSWPYWFSILKYIINLESQLSNPVLLHHPIGSKIGSNYLNCLNKKLNIPIISWNEWHNYKNKSKHKLSPIPYALAPNKNTKGVRINDSISSLLEIDVFLFSLIKLLVLLP